MFLHASNVLGVVAAGVLTGALGALLGTGGGVFLIPVLVMVLGMPMHYAVATSLVSVIATSSAVASTNVERGTANMRLGMTLEVATALGAIIGGLTAGWMAPRVLEGLFAAVLLPTALVMVLRPGEGAGADQSAAIPAASNGTQPADADDLGTLGGAYFDEAEQRTVRYRVRRLELGLGISLLAGSLSGLLGIGGGTFKVPALHLLCGVPIKAAAATSNFMIGVTAAASAFLYHGRGEIRPALTATVVVGVVLGSALGSLLNRRVPADSVRWCFAAMLVAVAFQMGYRAMTGAGGVP